MSEPRSPLHVLERGRGAPAILFVHGFANSSRLWSEMIDLLEGSHRCVAPDLRGFSRSPETGPRWSIEDHVVDLRRVCEAGRLDDFVLVGHSMGGKIATALAATRPTGLRRLILLASSPLGPEPMSDADREEALASHGDPRAVIALVDRVTRAPLSQTSRRAFIDDNIGASEKAWRWWLERGSREDLSDHAAMVRNATPVLLAGADDPVLPLELQRALAMQVGAEPPRVLPDTGHLLPIEAAEACASIVKQVCTSAFRATLRPPAPVVSGAAA